MRTRFQASAQLMLHPFQFVRVLRAHSEGRHYDGRLAARNLYGAIIVLAVLITAEGAAPGPLEAAIVLSITVAVVLGMETYAEVIASELTLRRSLTGAERMAALRDLMVVTSAAEAPLLFFVVAAAGLISEELAFTLAKWSTLALLFGYGFLARRLAGRSTGAAIRTGLTVAGIGVTLAFGKSHVHF